MKAPEGKMKSVSQFGQIREGPSKTDGRYERGKFQEQDDLKHRIMINERQKDLDFQRTVQDERLQKELEEIRNLKERMMLDISEKAEKQGREVENSYSRETEYQRHLSALRDAQMNSELKTQKEFEELKNLMQTLSKQRDIDQDKMIEIKNQREQPLLFDKIDQEKWKIIDGIISVPRKTVNQDDRAFAVQPDFDGKELTRADKAHLIHYGIKGLLDEAVELNVNTHENMEKNIKIELEDPLKASLILVQFLGFRPKIVNFTKKTQENEKITSLFGEDYSVPEKLFFTMNFFDYPLFETDVLTIEGLHEKGLSNMLASNQTLIFVKESYLRGGIEGKEATYKFEVDPSLTRSPDYYEEYVKYLYRKSLNIDIWDAEKLMLFGTIKVPLRNLLRQGRQVATLTREFDVIDPNFSRIKGSVQILLKNIGKSQQIMEMNDHKKGFFNNKDGKIKKKVKSKKPLQLPKGIKIRFFF